ncbi:helix-turn-helix domain-containing protein, partial [Bacillus thuringiensis]
MTLITRMKEYRVKLNMSQGDLANKVGVRRETI